MQYRDLIRTIDGVAENKDIPKAPKAYGFAEGYLAKGIIHDQIFMRYSAKELKDMGLVGMAQEKYKIEKAEKEN